MCLHVCFKFRYYKWTKYLCVLMHSMTKWPRTFVRSLYLQLLGKRMHQTMTFYWNLELIDFGVTIGPNKVDHDVCFICQIHVYNFRDRGTNLSTSRTKAPSNARETVVTTGMEDGFRNSISSTLKRKHLASTDTTEAL